MNRPYTAQSPYSLTPTERIRSPRRRQRDEDGYRSDDRYSDVDTDVYPPYPDGLDYEDYDDYEIDEASIDRRWMWIAGVAGAILFVSVIAASLILGGGDSGSVSATIASSDATTSEAPAPSSAPPVAAPPSASLPAETVTTVSPPPPATETPTAQTAAPLLPAPQAAPPPASAVPGTVTYRITGNRALIDLVTVIYTDAQGALQTDVNVALPWSKTVVLDPGVSLSSVTATSVGGQLNCSITDANGSLIAAQNNSSLITNCTR